VYKKKKLILSDGREYEGYGFGSDKNTDAEIIVCTSMTGYQEVLSNPANSGKIILMTYPIIGSYGLADEDYESNSLTIAGLAVREYNDLPSNFRYTKTLDEEMKECGVCGIFGLDTREIAKAVREQDEVRARVIDDPQNETGIGITYINPFRIKDVSCRKIKYSRTANFKYNVVAVDCGISNSAVKSLNSRGCNVIIVPFDTAADDIRFLKPHGLFISDGPGYPGDTETVVKLIRVFLGKIPVLGIGLGFLAIANTYGANIVRMKNGHCGSNYPVKSIYSKRISIVSQSHCYTVEQASLDDIKLEITHRNLNDDSIEGVADEQKLVSAVAFHPETTVDDTDTSDVYDRFITCMEQYISETGESNA